MSFETPTPRLPSIPILAFARCVVLAVPMPAVTIYSWLTLGPRLGIQVGIWTGVLEVVLLILLASLHKQIRTPPE